MITNNNYYTTTDDAGLLGWITESYLEGFVALYGPEMITPKMHQLIHLPLQILL